MNRTWLAVAFLGGFAGCNGGPSTSVPLQQLEYDLTVKADRDRFIESDMTYQGSVGPYAIYKITGNDPRLIGPAVQYGRGKAGYAMLCGATQYFKAPTALASQAIVSLYGGGRGTLRLVSSKTEATSDGQCVPPKDVFGNPVPDPPGGGGGGSGGGGTAGGGGTGTGGGTGGGTGTGTGGGTGTGTPGSPGGGTGTPGNPGGGTGVPGNPTGDPGTGVNDDCIEGCGGLGGPTGASGSTGTVGDPPASTDDVLIQNLNVAFERAPNQGSYVLLRRVALTGARIHNDSHIIPKICCNNGKCALGGIQ
jgi:hypothetical protein